MRARIASVIGVWMLFAASSEAALISNGTQDTTTLGHWRTAAPDGDRKYGTDGYVMLYYKQAVSQGYGITGYPNYTPATQDLASLPAYISSYQVPYYQGADGGTGGGGLPLCLEDPISLQQLATNHVWGHPNGGPAQEDVVVQFTMSLDRVFMMGIYASHEANPNPAWVQDYQVTGSLGGVGYGYNVPAPAGQWWVFSVDAKAGEVITLRALHQGGNGDFISAIAFDPVPEPGGFVLAGLGAGLLTAYRWRRRRGRIAPHPGMSLEP